MIAFLLLGIVITGALWGILGHETQPAPTEPAPINTCGQRGGHYYRKQDGRWVCVECGDVFVVQRDVYDQEAS